MDEAQLKEAIPDTQARTDRQTEHQLLRDNKGRYVKGVSGNMLGRPTHKSIIGGIRDKIDKDPKLYEALLNYYLKSDKHKTLLWTMIEGMPRQQIDQNVDLMTPIIFNVIKAPPIIEEQRSLKDNTDIGLPLKDDS